MKRDIDSNEGNGSIAALEYDRLSITRILGNICADGSLKGGVVQGPRRCRVGGVGKSIKGSKGTGTDILLELDVVVYDFEKGIGLAGNQIDELCYITHTEICAS